MTRFNKYIIGLLLALGSILAIFAQSSGDGYNPDNPSEPGNIDKISKHKVTVELGTEGAGTVSGGGDYKYGTSITVKATAVSGYKFLHWLKDDGTEPYRTTASFTHTVEGAVKFTAVYERIKQVYAYVSETAAGKATATKRTASSGGEEAVLTATVNASYEFLHWLKNDETEPFSTAKSFVYPLADDDYDVRFTAVYKFVYNPENPAEPTDIDHNVRYNVNVSINDERAGVVSGLGRYKYGETVTISTSGAVGYEFKGWLMNGQPHTTAKSFQYTVDTEDVDFVAEYVNTAEQLEEFGHAVYLTTNQQGSCTFNVESGKKYMKDDAFSVTAIPGTDQVFDGWYVGSTLIATTLKYSSYMQDEDITLSAHFRYVPDNPDEPTNPGGYVEEVEEEGILGDVDEDGVVDMNDVAILLKHYLANSTDSLNKKVCDIDGDGSIDMNDVASLLSIYLKAQ